MLVGEVRMATTGSGSAWKLSGASQWVAAPTNRSKKRQCSSAYRIAGAPAPTRQPALEPRGRRAERARDPGARKPETGHRQRRADQRVERVGAAPDQHPPGRGGERADAEGHGGPHRAPDGVAAAGDHVLGLRGRLPLEQLPPGDDQAPQRADDGVDRDPGLVRQEGDRERELLHAGQPRRRRPARSRRGSDLSCGGRSTASSRATTSASRPWRRWPSRVQRSGSPGSTVQPARKNSSHAGSTGCGAGCRGSSSARAARAGWARGRRVPAPAPGARAEAASRPGSSGACAG